MRLRWGRSWRSVGVGLLVVAVMLGLLPLGPAAAPAPAAADPAVPVRFAGPMDYGAYGGSSWTSQTRPVSELGGFSVYAVEVRAAVDGGIYVRDYAGILRFEPRAGTFRRVIGTSDPWGTNAQGGPFDLIGEDADEVEVGFPWLTTRQLATDPLGQLIFTTGDGIFRVSATGEIQHLAGIAGQQGSSGDGGPATAAQVDVSQLVVDPTGVIWFLSDSGSRLRRIDLDGTISTVAGTGVAGDAGDGGLAASALISASDLAVVPGGEVYLLGAVQDPVTAASTTTLRRIDGTTGVITSIPVGPDACLPFGTYVSGSVTLEGTDLRFVSRRWNETRWFDCRISTITGASSATDLGIGADDAAAGAAVYSNIERGPDGVLWWMRYDESDDFANSGLVRLGTPTVGAVPDVSVSLSAPSAVPVQEPFGLEVTLANEGTATATDVSLTLSANDANLTYEGWDLGDTCSWAPGPPQTVTCVAPTLAPGTSVDVPIEASAEQAADVVVEVTVTSSSLDADADDQEVSTSVVVGAQTTTTTTTTTTPPQPAGPSGSVVYTAEVYDPATARGYRKGFAFDATGGTPRRLTASPAAMHEYSPSPSPDGHAVALIRDFRNGNGQRGRLAVYDVGAEFATWSYGGRSSDPVDPRTVAWSPDGSTLAVIGVAKPSGEVRLYTIPADGSAAPTQLPAVPNLGTSTLRWSPSGDRLLVERTVGGYRRLSTVVVPTGSIVDVAAPAAVSMARGDWSPDGTSVLFGMLGAVYRSPAAGGGAAQLVRSGLGGNGGVVSPDGRWMVGSDRIANQLQLAIVDLDSAANPVLPDLEGTAEAWTSVPIEPPTVEPLPAPTEPLAGRIAYSLPVVDGGGTVVGSKVWQWTPGGVPARLTATADGVREGNARFVPGGERVTALVDQGIGAAGRGLASFEVGGATPTWIVQGYFIDSYDLSPDGTQVAFSGFRDGTSVRAIWVAPVDRSSEPRLVREVPRDGSSAISLAWSPAGALLAVRLWGSANQVWTVDVGDGAATTVADRSAGLLEPQLAWSADGTELFGAQADVESGLVDVVRFDLAGQAAPTHLPSRNDRHLALGAASPGGSWIATTETGTTDVVFVPTDGAAMVTLPTGATGGFRISDWIAGTAGNPSPELPTFELDGPPRSYLDVGRELSFSISDAADPDGFVVGGVVDWGDGTVEPIDLLGRSGATVGHAYDEPGTYDVTVTVRDAAGTTSTPVSRRAYVSRLVATLSATQGPVPFTTTIDLGSSELALPAVEYQVDGIGAAPLVRSQDAFPVTLEEPSDCRFPVVARAIDPADGTTVELATTTTPACVAVAPLGAGGIASTRAGDVWVQPADGADPVQLTIGAEIDRNPRWDDTGHRIVFERAGDVWLVTTSGTIEQLTDGSEAERDADLYGDELVFVRGASPAQLVVRHLDTNVERVLASGPELSGARWSPQGDRVAFSDGTSIRVIGADGLGDRAVVTSLADPRDPAWSPSGESLAFSSTHGAAPAAARLWRVQVSTGAVRIVGSGVAGSSPSFSPGGDRIVHQASTAQPGDVVRDVALDGSGPVQVACCQRPDAFTTFDADASGDWAPEPPVAPGAGGLVAQLGSDLIVYPDPATQPGSYQTLLDLDPRPGESSPWNLNPAWDETGTRLVISRAVTTTGELWTVDRDGSDLRKVPVGIGGIYWEADLHGSSIVGVRNVGPGAFHTDLIDVETGARTLLRQSSVQPRSPAFSPDGQRIAFVESGAAYVMEADGSNVRTLVPASRGAGGVSWSPDGTRLLVTTFAPSFTSTSSVATVPATGGAYTTVLRGGPATSVNGIETATYGPGASRIAFGSQVGFAIGGDAADLTQVPAGRFFDWYAPRTGILQTGGDITIGVTDIDDGSGGGGGGGGGAVDPGCTPAPGDCTLNEAIDHINEHGDDDGNHVIDLPDATDPVVLSDPIHEITKPVTLIGGGSIDDLLPDGSVDESVGTGNGGRCAAGAVYLDGSGLPDGTHGIRIRTGRDTSGVTRLHRLVIASFEGDGVHVVASANVRLNCSSILWNGGAGVSVHDSIDVAAVGDVAVSANEGDGYRVTGASRRVRTWAGSTVGNGGLAIDLGDDGVTANDDGDGDTGPNALVNHPEIVRIDDDPTFDDPSRRSALIRVRHDVSAGPFRIDLYDSGSCDASGHGELRTWLAGGRANLSSATARVVRVPFSGSDSVFSATVTTGSGTSEASRCVDLRGDGTTGPVGPVANATGTTGPDGPITSTGTGGGDGSGGDGSYGGDVDDDGRGPTGGGSGGGGTDGDAGPVQGGDPVGGGDGPVDSTPSTFDVGGHLVIGKVGLVTVEPAPGVLDDLVGGVGPFQVEASDGGTMPPAAWSVDARTGAVTVDARSLAKGTYTGAFRVSDALGRSTGDRLIVFHIEPRDPIALPDRGPLARPDRVLLAPGSRVTFSGDDNLLENDSDELRLVAERVAGGTLPPARATVRANGDVVVDAVGLAEGTYTFLYRARASDGQLSDPTTVTVVVDNFNACATAVDDTWTVWAGELTRVTPADGVLANDVDPEGAPLTARLYLTFTSGALRLFPDGSMTIDARGYGSDGFWEFEYWAVDPFGELCDRATVRINRVERPNEPPTAKENVFVVGAGQRLTVPAQGVLGNDTDPDGPELGLRARIVDRLPGLSLRSDGGFTYQAPTTIGGYEATYEAYDPHGGVSPEETITFLVVPVPEAPPPNRVPVATSDTFYRVHADEVLEVTAADGVLANDVDPDDELFAEPTVEDPRFPLLRDGSFTFKPSMSDIGKTFTYRYRAIEKGYTGQRSPVATVEIKVVAPRERCVQAEGMVDIAMLDEFDGPGIELGGATVPFGWCHDRTKVTRIGMLDEAGGFQSGRGSIQGPGRAIGDLDVTTGAATDSALGLYLLLDVQEVEEDRASTVIFAGSKTAQLLMRPEWKVCINPVQFILDLVVKLRHFTDIPWLKKLLKAADLGLLISRIEPVADALASGFAQLLEPLAALLPGGDAIGVPPDQADLLGVLGAVLRWVEGLSVTIDYPEPNTTWAMTDLYRELVDKYDEVAGAIRANADGDCIPIGPVLEAAGLGTLRNAFGMFYAQVVPRDDPATQYEPDGDFGLFEHAADINGALTLGQGSDLGWFGDVERTAPPIVVGCDLTRTRDGQVNPPPPQMPGDPPRTC